MGKRGGVEGETEEGERGGGETGREKVKGRERRERG